ncbi:hypothetical protein [Falsibacillus pallidus]|uniref:hypothetical protein n=1 Tax=Falsibacillus pallidus TaxID=493781 RepID=UPI003D999B2B
MKNGYIEALPNDFLDWNSFNVKLPRNVKELLRNDHDYTIIGSVDIKISKLEKNDSLLRQTVKKFEDVSCFEGIYEDDNNYYLTYQNPDMTNCFSFMDLFDELHEMEHEMKEILHGMHLVDFEMTFIVEAYNHG